MLSTANKIVDRETLRKECEKIHAAGLTIVTCNGSFDLFHYGHLCFLEEAKKQVKLKEKRELYKRKKAEERNDTVLVNTMPDSK